MPVVEGHGGWILVHGRHGRRAVYVTHRGPLLGLRMWRMLRVRRRNRRAAVRRQLMVRRPVRPREVTVLRRPLRYPRPWRASKRSKGSHSLRRRRGDGMSSHRHRRVFWWRRRRRRRGNPKRLRLAVGLVTFVALELSLLDKLLRLGSQVIVIPVRHVFLLAVINRPPFGANVDTTCDADADTEALALHTIGLAAVPISCPTGCWAGRREPPGACG